MGHIISEDGVATDPDKTKAVREMPKPRTKIAPVRPQIFGFASAIIMFIYHPPCYRTWGTKIFLVDGWTEIQNKVVEDRMVGWDGAGVSWHGAS